MTNVSKIDCNCTYVGRRNRKCRFGLPRAKTQEVKFLFKNRVVGFASLTSVEYSGLATKMLSGLWNTTFDFEGSEFFGIVNSLVGLCYHIDYETLEREAYASLQNDYARRCLPTNTRVTLCYGCLEVGQKPEYYVNLDMWSVLSNGCRYVEKLHGKG